MMRLAIRSLAETITQEGTAETITQQAGLWLQRVLEVPETGSAPSPMSRDLLPEARTIIIRLWDIAAERRWRVVTVWNYWRVGRIQLDPELDRYRLMPSSNRSTPLPVIRAAAAVNQARLEEMPSDFI
jgi:hypothetical protein